MTWIGPQYVFIDERKGDRSMNEAWDVVHFLRDTIKLTAKVKRKIWTKLIGSFQSLPLSQENIKTFWLFCVNTF